MFGLLLVYGEKPLAFALQPGMAGVPIGSNDGCNPNEYIIWSHPNGLPVLLGNLADLALSVVGEIGIKYAFPLEIWWILGSN